MNADQLKASLLQQAIEGKLVPQLDSEEEVELIGEIIQEVPFPIPAKWKWFPAQKVYELLSGRDLPKSEVLEMKPEGKSFPYITGASQIDKGEILINRWTRNCVVKSQVDDILLTCKGTVGKTAINTIGDLHIARQIMALRANTNVITTSFLKLVISSLSKQLANEAKSIIPGIDRKTLMSKLIPIPPLREQARIVAKFEELLPLVEAYGKSYDRLQELNAELPNKLKASILQEAIQGKLVPQLAKEGIVEQIGVVPKEVPFEIPESWKWMQFKQTCSSLDGKRIPLKKDDREKLEKRYPYYGATGVIDFVDDYILDGMFLLIGEDGANLLSRSKDNAFIASGKIWVNNHAHVFEENGVADLRYLALMINATSLSPYVTGSAQPKLTQKNLYSIPVPIPPIQEQVRIVAKVEELLKQVEALSTR